MILKLKNILCLFQLAFRHILGGVNVKYTYIHSDFNVKDTAIHRIIYLGNVAVPNENFYGIESENAKNNGDSTLLSFYILF